MEEIGNWKLLFRVIKEENYISEAEASSLGGQLSTLVTSSSVVDSSLKQLLCQDIVSTPVSPYPPVLVLALVPAIFPERDYSTFANARKNV